MRSRVGVRWFNCLTTLLRVVAVTAVQEPGSPTVEFAVGVHIPTLDQLAVPYLALCVASRFARGSHRP